MIKRPALCNAVASGWLIVGGLLLFALMSTCKAQVPHKAGRGADRLPTMNIDQKEEPNACNAAEAERLKHQIIDGADGHAWSLVFASLCSKSAEAKKLLEQHSTKRVLGISKGAGGQAIALMARRNAWSASANFDDGGFTVSYWINEACIRSIGLRQIAGSWLIAELSETCD